MEKMMKIIFTMTSYDTVKVVGWDEETAPTLKRLNAQTLVHL
jgi:hypothetical protein